jgi:hypothetical protein
VFVPTGGLNDPSQAGNLVPKTGDEDPATENSIYRGTAPRSDLVLLGGHYGRGWFAVGELGYDRAWLTYIKNSDW